MRPSTDAGVGRPSDTGRGLSVLSHKEVTLPGRPPTVPWRRVARLLRPLRWGREAALLSVAIAGALLVQAIAYVLSDGMYYRNAGRLHRSLRLRMFDGLRHRAASDDEEQSGIPSRFISDVLTVDQITVGLLDTGSMVLVQFLSAAIAIGLLDPVALAVIFPMLGSRCCVFSIACEPGSRIRVAADRSDWDCLCP
jgi:hypothetical protein